jgi:hypothetical protein
MEETERRFKERIQCTHGATERCRDSITTPIVSTAPKNTPSPQELAVAQEVRYLQAKAHQDDSILEGPMYQLSASACTANIGAASLFVFYTPKGNSSYSGPIPLYVGTIRFQKLATISTSSESITTFGTALKNRLNYIYDSPMLHYSCTAFAKDTSTLFVLRDVYAFARTHVLSSYATSSEKGALKKLEETQQVVSEHDVSNYLRMAQQVPLPKNLHEQVTEYALAYQFRSAHFDASIGELLNDEFSNSLLMSSLWPVNLDVPYLFFVRSSFSMLLLADNASAGKEVSLFETNTLPSSKRPFIYYGNLPHTAQSVYQVIMDIRLFYEVHVDPKILETDVTAR